VDSNEVLPAPTIALGSKTSRNSIE
jgi:hypothetical protein